MTNAEKVLTGQSITEHLIEKAAEEVYSTIKPLPNTAGTPGYRKKIGRVLVKRALKELVLGVNEWIRDPSGLHRS
jgi:carbon-monoxide dehydrogenase medium subunit